MFDLHRLWDALGFQPDPLIEVNSLHTITRPAEVPATQFEAFALLCCWQIWKQRNGFVFQGETANLHRTLVACRAEAEVWGARAPKGCEGIGTRWCETVSLATSSKTELGPIL